MLKCYMSLQVIKAASCGDRKGVVSASIDLGFLTGYETKVHIVREQDKCIYLRTCKYTCV